MRLQALTSVHTLKNPSNGIYITVCTEEYSTHLDNHPWRNVAVQVAGELVSHFKSFAHCLPSPKTGMQKKRQEATHPFCLHTQCRNSECGLVPLWTTRPPARETPGPPTICPPPAGTVCVPPVSQDPLSPMPWHRPGLAGCARGTSLREAGSSCSPPHCSRPWTWGREVQATVSTAPITFSLPIHNFFTANLPFPLPVQKIFTPNLQPFHSQFTTFFHSNSQDFNSQFTRISLPSHNLFHSQFTTFAVVLCIFFTPYSQHFSLPLHNLFHANFIPNSQPFHSQFTFFTANSIFFTPIHKIFTSNSQPFHSQFITFFSPNSLPIHLFHSQFTRFSLQSHQFKTFQLYLFTLNSLLFHSLSTTFSLQIHKISRPFSSLNFKDHNYYYSQCDTTTPFTSLGFNMGQCPWVLSECAIWSHIMRVDCLSVCDGMTGKVV